MDTTDVDRTAPTEEPVRWGLTMLPNAQPSIRVVGEAADGVAAVKLAREVRPDVALLDIRMPRLDGIEATTLLAGPDAADPLAVVVITTFDLDEFVYGALRAGAKGFLLKGTSPLLVTEALHAAASGEALISPRIPTRLLAESSRPQCLPRQPSAPLSEREEQVLALLASGLTNDEIGAHLYLSRGTIKTHIGGILTNLGVRNRVEAAMWALESGRHPRG
ncbi:response regulator transcription factor [Cellulosimicrobium terreum]|nr:response regulator transcription factor [Cellulosimicrobium terreum]